MLKTVIAPMPEDDFLANYWTKQFIHIPGPADKFQDLFSWDVLNDTLADHRFAFPRLALVKAAQTLPPDRYMAGTQIHAPRLRHELADGATLVVNGCDEVHSPLRDLCVSLERLFHVRVSANLYAGWRVDRGFDIHWDPQDTLILQVAGRKHWKVWSPTRLYPFEQDVVDTSPATKPDVPPIWDGLLEAGSVLSMPRGWWHVAYPVDEPCLHLTITVKNVNGIDLLHWLAERMKTSDAARMDVPVLATAEARRTWLATVWRDLTVAWNDDDVIDRYVGDLDRGANPRPSLHLPDVKSPQDHAIDRHTRLQLALPRPLMVRASNGTTSFRAGGTRWRTNGRHANALTRFNDGQPHTIAEVSTGNDGDLVVLLTALLMKGVVCRAES
jgi:ribosomal protein L16 Arg81 hydroxylase